MADKTATFGIRVPVDTNAAAGANAVDALRRQIEGSQDAVKRYSSSLKNLRGDSLEVKSAKEGLKAAINAERDAISRSTLALGKHGATVIDTVKKTKDATGTHDALKNKLREVHPAVSSVMEGFDKLKGAVTGSNGAMVAAVGAAGALAAAMVAVTAGVIGAGVGLGKFILEEGNALRTMGLLREAAGGSAENAKALGSQIEALGFKVPQSRKELNEMAVDLTRMFAGTRVTGQGMVDTFNAVAQASAAMGQQAGGKLREVIERSKTFGRMGLGLNELQGTGIDFGDVAGQLAKDLHVGLADAQRQLMMGYVNVNAGASAIRKVVEQKFGRLNLRQMLDLNVMSVKFKDTLSKLTEGVNLEPVLAGFERLIKFFDTGTVTGSALKDLITNFGNTVGAVFKASIPWVERFGTQFLIEMTRLELGALKVGLFLKEHLHINLKKLFAVLEEGGGAITAAKVAFDVLAAAVIGTGVAFGTLAAGVAGVYEVFKDVYDIYKTVYDAFTSADWGAVGANLIDGLIDGIKGGIGRLESAVTEVATSAKEKFKDFLGIHSPSKVFEGYGKNIDEGLARGVGKNGRSEDAILAMVPPSPREKYGESLTRGGAEKRGEGGAPILSLASSVPTMPSGGGKLGGTTISIGAVEVHVAFPNAKNGHEVATALTGPTFKAQLTKAIEEAFMGIGVPTQAPQGG